MTLVKSISRHEWVNIRLLILHKSGKPQLKGIQYFVSIMNIKTTFINPRPAMLKNNTILVKSS